MRIVFALSLLCGVLAPPVRADEGTDFFEREIRPVLVEHCYECHSAKSKIVKGGLLVDTREGIRKGGDSGPAVVPGKLDESLILGALKHETFEMPPERRLPEPVVKAFEKWIFMGAPDPREGASASTGRTIDLAAGRQFWSYRPVAPVAVPEADLTEWSTTPIDRFIAHGWKPLGLVPAELADRRTLIRRVTFDLTGLPPTVAEIEAFVADAADDSTAFGRVVDRLLASPHFGERWGRHWLDLARFSESTGGGRSMLIPEAWRYRDYVVQAFNRDKPFDRFIMEQIAGDQLPHDTLEGGADQLTGTSFLALGPTNYEEQDKTQLEMDVIDEQIDTLGKVFLGQTIGCARCHDHKFDPIPTADYYALAGIFRSTQTLIHDNVSTWVTKPLPRPPEVERKLAVYEEQKGSIEKRLAETEKELRTLEKKNPVVILGTNYARYEGRWEKSPSTLLAPGSERDEQVSAGAGEAVFEVGSAIPAAGPYEVRLAYVSGDGRSKRVQVRIRQANGEATVTLDQTTLPQSGGRFASLGDFSFAPDSKHSVTIVASGEGETAVGMLVLLPKFSVAAAPTSGGIVPVASLPGIVVDDAMAVTTGEWTTSTSVKSFVGDGYRHDAKSGKGEKRITFSADLPKSGEYEVRLAYHATDSRARHVPVRITHPAGEALVHVDQTVAPPIDGLFRALGRYRFANDQTAVVTISTEGTTGFVIADAVQFLPVEAAAPDDATAAAPQAPAETGDVTAVVDTMVALRKRMQQMNGRLTELKTTAPPAPPKVPSVWDEKKVEDGYVCIRGSYKHRGPTVPRGFLQVASVDGNALASPALGTSGRLELARWIASRDNPLTARVYVNRVWHHLFGAGLVRTVDNFGSTGEAASHPELLDDLARRFVDDGWSTKRLIREMLLSRTYRLASQPSLAAREKDPENRLLSHARRKRLDSEELYDSLLALGGTLDRSVGGDTVRPGTKSEYGYKFDVGRRAIYLPIFRNRLPELFGVFDFADPNSPVGARNVTTLPTQSLFLMNNPLVLAQSRQTAERLLKGGDDDGARLARLSEEALGRSPSDVERAAFEAFLREPAPANKKERLDRWTALVQTLVASIDFRYLD